MDQGRRGTRWVAWRHVSSARRLFTAQGWPYLLVPFIPIALALDLAGGDPVPVFFTSALGVIPTAALMGRATEELAARSGPGIGGLLNVTFGNAPELIIALFALGSGLHEVVKASIIGSILGNTLLVLGGAMFIGGLGRDRQRFDRTAASVQSAMLLLAVAVFIMPAIFELVEGRGLPAPGAERVHYDSTVEHLSLLVSIVLILTYVAGLVFSLKTHRSLFNPGHGDDDAPAGPPPATSGPQAPAREAVPADPDEGAPADAGAAVPADPAGSTASRGPSAGPSGRSRSPAWPWASCPRCSSARSRRPRRRSACPSSSSASSSWPPSATPPSTGWRSWWRPRTRWTWP